MKNKISAFEQLALSPTVLETLTEIGYETPSPIQAQAIPLLLEGADLIGQAQTGTGKTAAFALPTLSTIDTTEKSPQVLVLTPTRELALQVAAAYENYARKIKGFRVMAVYGGQDYRTQTKALQRGPQVVVGTPGRLIDQLKRGNIKLDALKTLVLDEADEMLRMGFIDDVEWILDKTPSKRQTALFSATMPTQIRRMADRYLKEPQHVTVEFTSRTADTIRQRYWFANFKDKFRNLTEMLEVEPVDAMIVFVRTRSTTTELSDRLADAGFKSAALNGDMQQKLRERTIDQLKKGKIDIIVATDVAARGLDVERVSHVLNYDSPHDVEAYIHRIGRTGRAGRSGEAILFVTNREKRLLQSIQSATGKQIEHYEFPSPEELKARRLERFSSHLETALSARPNKEHAQFIQHFIRNNDVDAEQLAVALASQFIGSSRPAQNHTPSFTAAHSRPAEQKGRKKHADAKAVTAPRAEERERKAPEDLPPMVRYRVEVGADHGAKVGNIVGAIANEAGIDNQYIGRVKVLEDHSLIDLPEGMPKAIYKDLRKVWVCSRQLQISRFDADKPTGDNNRGHKKHSPQKSKPSPAGSKQRHGDKNRNKKQRRPKATSAMVAAG